MSAYGVNIKPPQSLSSYADPAVVFTAACASGAGWVRDNMTFGSTAWPKQLALWQRLRDVGIDVQVIAGTPNHGTTARPQIEAQLREAASCLTAVEGWNEPDDVNRLADIASHQRFLWDTVKTTPALAHVKVVAPSLLMGPSVSDATARARFSALYGAIAGRYDYANLHVYPGGKHPSADYLLDKRLTQIGVSPVMVTEGGYVTGASGGAAVYSETDQARWLVDYVHQASVRDLPFAAYELIDNVGYFGLFTAAGTPKAAVRALRKMT